MIRNLVHNMCQCNNYVSDRIDQKQHYCIGALKVDYAFRLGKRTRGYRGEWVGDRLEKEAAVEYGPVVYDKMPREVIITREKENAFHMWKRQWTKTEKGAVTKALFPSVRNRLRQKIPIFPEFTTMVTGRGKLKSYLHLHRFGLTDNPMCQWGGGGEEEEGYRPLNISV